MGFQADVAISGQQAIQMVIHSDSNIPYNLLFVDWKMPRLDGIETAKNISENEMIQNKPSIVLISAYDKEEMRKHALDIPVDEFLSKPVTQSCLYDTIVNIFSEDLGQESKDTKNEEMYPLEGTHVLLAEDNLVNQQIACEILESYGVSVEVANNGIEAVEKFLSNQHWYDMILMDIQMPEMDGISASKQIRKLSLSVPIIAMTARTMMEEKEKCYESGMNDHIAKPINPDILLSTIEKWKNQSGNLPTETAQSIRKETNQNGVSQLDDLPLRKIYGIDVDDGLMRVGGNVKLYEKLIGQFVMNQKENVEKLLELYNMADFDQLERGVHQLKGVAGNIGATCLYERSSTVEKMIVEHLHNSDMENAVNLIVLEFNKISGSIEDVLMNRNMEVDNDTLFQKDSNVEKERKNEHQENRIEVLAKLLEVGDISAISYFEEHSKDIRRRMNQDVFELLKKKLDTYEFDEALALLSK
jgi:CheY-like chemotaxis protein/HPt (histidine-containing phosphotransfer) domain-containing protein